MKKYVVNESLQNRRFTPYNFTNYNYLSYCEKIIENLIF